ncbi:hypothetical protein [Nafulsella turpanensis]|uniref:hypothetical protein n=1 Tax=Nafulsella turpanensis TaxID=1265690 RepID=UPI00034DF3D7|nr:hypothetical protein [Nafulsella turpanensis]
MKITKVLMVFLFAGVALFSSCEDENAQMANVAFTTITSGDIDGDVTGNGGSTSKNFKWNNSLSTADYNMDITAAKSGSFQLLVKDSNGKVVLDKTVVAGQGEDSRSGVTTAGASGEWTVTVNLTDFNGDGSFSFSKGD